MPAVQLVPAPGDGRVYRHRLQVGLADTTPSGRARLDAVARWLQDAAWADVVDAGFAEAGSVWVVRRLHVRVERFPRFGEALEAATFCSGTGALWAERRTTVRGDAGGLVEASGLWVHLDRNGRPRPLPEGFGPVYGAAAGGRRVKARLRHPGEPPAGAESRPWRFRAADLDLAGHVNNAVYWQVLEEELLGEEPAGALVAEIEHRAAGDAGEATVHAAGAHRWIVAPDGTVLATLALG